MDHAQANPALPPDHPFTSVELAWYWSATPYAANPTYAWYVHTEGGRMFFGDKGRSYYVWPVRGASPRLPVTGGPEPASGVAWPTPALGKARRHGARPPGRPELEPERRPGPRPGELVPGPGASPRGPTPPRLGGLGGWRLPSIAELELLVDAGRAFPALDPAAPFGDLRPQYWSGTTSGFDPAWAMALYLDKGGVGVGMKKDPHYHLWLVSPATSSS